MTHAGAGGQQIGDAQAAAASAFQGAHCGVMAPAAPLPARTTTPSGFLAMQIQPTFALHDEMGGPARAVHQQQHQQHGHYQPPPPPQQAPRRSLMMAPVGPGGKTGPIGATSAQLGGGQQSFLFPPLAPPTGANINANQGSQASSAPRINLPSTAPLPPAAPVGAGAGPPAAPPAFAGASGPFFSELLPGAPGGSLGLLPPLYPSSLDTYGVVVDDAKPRALREDLSGLTPEQKLHRRRQRARVYSHFSRLRHKASFESLQQQVSALTKFRDIIESAPQLVGVLSPDTNAVLLYANDAFGRVLHLTPGRLLGSTFNSIVHRDDHAAVTAAIAAAALLPVGEGIEDVRCRLEADYPSRFVRGLARLTRGSQGVVFSFWPDHMFEDGELPDGMNG